ncbi:MAG: hypothetical protein IKW13_02040 [Thermoguttaceae bacterium]|nr:hypothetical protein [Thermoguttaceae bacterium]
MGRRTNDNGTLTTAIGRRRAALRGVATLLAIFWTVASAFSAPDSQSDAASTNALEAVAVNVGLDGVYKNGFQTRVVASWKGSAARVELETLDSDGTPFVVAKTPTVEENQEGRAEFSIALPKAGAALTLRCVDENGTPREQTFKPSVRSGGSETVFLAPAAASKPIYLVVGEGEVGLDDAFSALRWNEARRPTVVRFDSLAQAPTDWRSYEAVDRLILTTANPDVFAGADATDARIVAIERWLERGGEVVLLAGAESISLLKKGGALSAFSPGAQVADAPHEFRVVNSLLANLEGVKNLAMTGTKSSPYLRVPVVSELKPNAVVGMREAETPLFVERPVGLGTVAFFASDLATPPFSNWTGRPVLWAKILGIAALGTATAADAPVYVKRGYRDISGQLRSANDVFEGVAAPSFALALALMFVYLLVVGPLDWFLAKKIFKRSSTTWATFPIFVLLFGALAVWATSATRTNEPRLNQIDLIDIDVESGVVRDVSWLGLYSPKDGRRDLTFSAGDASAFGSAAKFVEPPTATLTPLTLSGDGVGGAEQRTFAPRVWDAPYSGDATVDSTASLKDAPFLARSSKSFVGRWTGRLEPLPRGDLYDDGLGLRGTIVNPLDVPIYSAFVIYAGGAYSLGTLAPGETKLERSAIRLEPRRVLNEHRSSVPTERAERWNSTDYNAGSRRVPYILRAASFYDLGGGLETYGLEKRLQADVDLSDLVRCGRAVVYGTVVDPEAEKYRPLEEGAKSRSASAKGKTDAELAVEKFGLFGSSEEMKPTVATSPESDGETVAPSKRTVAVRLILPLRRGAAPGEER